MNISKLIIELPDETKSKFKVKCAKIGKSQKEVITKLIESWLKKKGK